MKASVINIYIDRFVDKLEIIDVNYDKLDNAIYKSLQRAIEKGKKKIDEKEKKRLVAIIRDILKEETNPYKEMTKEEVEAWFKGLMKRVVLNENSEPCENTSGAHFTCPCQSPNASQVYTGDCHYCNIP